jgi:6-methylsalicylate decarboxylase
MERMRVQGRPTRRDIVASAAAGAGALLAGKLAWAQTARSSGQIDLHHHYFPPAFLDAQRHAALRQSRPAALGAALEGWSKARTIEAMDRNGIAIGILSISTPGPWFGNIEESKRLARECNDYAAEMMRDHSGRCWRRRERNGVARRRTPRSATNPTLPAGKVRLVLGPRLPKGLCR